jgi:hypothetical protein
VRPILKALCIRVPGFKKQEISFEEALEREEETKKEWQIMYESHAITPSLCMSACFSHPHECPCIFQAFS